MMTSPGFRYLALVFSLSLVSCAGGTGGGGGEEDPTPSLCNGVQDLGEFSIDEPYDVDGDGFFSAQDPGCASHYPAEQLDCDDSVATVHPGASEVACNELDDDCDALTLDVNDVDMDGHTDCDGDCDDTSAAVHPGATEIECNDIDEDCDGEDAGEGCISNRSGVWALDTNLQYSCDGLTVGTQELTLSQVVDSLTVTPTICDDCNGPPALEGEVNADDQASVNAAQDVATGCSANYSMVLTFTGSTTAVGLLSISFGGLECNTLGCVPTTQPLSFGATLAED